MAQPWTGGMVRKQDAAPLVAAALLLLCTGWAAAQPVAEGQTALAHPAPAAAPVAENQPCYQGANFTAGDCPGGSCWASQPNGCGSSSQSIISSEIVPDKWPGGVDFSQACILHDFCYRTVGADRAACDQAFLDDLQAECQQSLGGGGSGGGGGGGDGGLIAEAGQALSGGGDGGGGEGNPAVEACNGVAQGYYEGIRSQGQEPFDQDQAEQEEHERRCMAG